MTLFHRKYSIKFFCFFLINLISVTTLSFQASAAQTLPPVNIAIVSDGASSRVAQFHALFKQEILELTQGEFDVKFPEAIQRHGDWRIESVRLVVKQLINDDQVDMILALGPLVSNEVVQYRNLNKPVIAPIIIDPEMQGLVPKKGVSGIRNLNYLTAFDSFERDLVIFKQTVGFERVAVLVDSLVLQAVTKMQQKIQRLAGEQGLSLSVIGINTSAKEALAALPDQVQAVYMTPLARFEPEEVQVLFNGLVQRRLPSFSMMGRNHVEQGVLLGLAPATDISRLARRVALNVQRILLGEDAGTLSVNFDQGEELTFNMTTARAIGFSPSWSLLSEAIIIGEQAKSLEPKQHLVDVVKLAVEKNLDMAIQQRVLAVGEEKVRSARSSLFPQLELSAQSVWIDDDRARAARGQSPERESTASLNLSQLLYSEKARAQADVQVSLQLGREQERDAVRLDIISETATTYFNVLKAQTLLRIQTENLKLTRSHLKLSRVREAIGASGPAEVYRWESELANHRQNVLAARTKWQQTQIALNRLLHQSLEKTLNLAETDVKDNLFLHGNQRFMDYSGNPDDFKILRDFFVSEGLNAAPELAQFDASIESQQRQLKAAKRAFWVPDLLLKGSLSERFARGGAGSESIPGVNDHDWSVALAASFPLYTSGGKTAERSLAREELMRLRLLRQATAERIEQRIRSALQETASSFPSIDLSLDAEAAAKRNLELTSHSYSQGVVSIIDLIDAQNAMLVAEQSVINNRYQFFIDLLEVQRAAGQFAFYMDENERMQWFQRMETFFQKTGE